MELPADGQVWLSNGLVLFFLGLFVYMRRVDRNWIRESLKELRETVDRYAAEAKADREKGFAEAKKERESLSSLLSQVAERTARIEGRQQGRSEIRIERQLQKLIEHGVASSAASD